MIPYSVTALSCLAVLAYLVILWWQLHDEPKMPWLALLCLAALVLRVIHQELPPHYYQVDEVDNVLWAQRALLTGHLTGTTDHYTAGLLFILFGAVPSFWFPDLPMGALVRGYSVILGSLTPAAAYISLRALGGKGEGPWVAAVLLAVLPWSLWYGRQPLGGEIIFHSLILLTMIARLLRDDGAGWREYCVGSLMLTLCLYDYVGGAIAIALPAIGVLLCPTWRTRLWSGGILLTALGLWFPNIASNVLTHDIFGAVSNPTGVSVGSSMNIPMLHPGFAVSPVATLIDRLLLALRCLYAPVGHYGYATAPPASMHPIMLLPYAALGWAFGFGWRQKFFLLLFFFSALLPAVISNHWSISSHRMMLALPIVSLALAQSVELYETKWIRALWAGVLIGVAVPWSLWFYFGTACGDQLGLPLCPPNSPVTFWHWNE